MNLQPEIERDAEQLWHAARLAPGATMARLSLALLGSGPSFAPMLAQAELVWVRGQPRIFVRRGTPAARARWLAGHELAHWWYQRAGCDAANIEERCDRLGAALVAPRAVLVAVSERIASVHRIARELNTTQSLVTLRLGEVTGRSVAVVKPDARLTRGAPWPQWPPLGAVRKVRITDEPNRSGMIAAA